MRDEHYRDARRTRIDPVDLITSLARAFVEIADRRADTADARALVELVAAQARHEMADDATTPEDDDVAYLWNITGLKREDGYPWQTLGTHEVVSNVDADRFVASGVATEQKFAHAAKPGFRAVYFVNLGPERSHRATHFRAFDSLDSATWWSLRKYLVEGSRYAVAAVQRALYAGDATGFALALKALGYYTADKFEYAAAVGRQLVKVKRDAARVDWAALPIVSTRTARKLTSLGSLTLHEAIRSQGGGNDGEV